MLGIISLKSNNSLINVNGDISNREINEFFESELSYNPKNVTMDTLILFGDDVKGDGDGLLIDDKIIVWKTLSSESKKIVKDYVNSNKGDVQRKFHAMYFPLNKKTSKLFKKKFNVSGKDFFDLEQEILVLRLTIEMMIHYENPQPYILKFLEFSGIIPTIMFLDVTLKEKLIGIEEVELKQPPIIERDISETFLKGVKLPFPTTEIRLIPKKLKWKGLHNSIKIYFRNNPPTNNNLFDMVDMDYEFNFRTWIFILTKFQTRFENKVKPLISKLKSSMKTINLLYKNEKYININKKIKEYNLLVKENEEKIDKIEQKIKELIEIIQDLEDDLKGPSRRYTKEEIQYDINTHEREIKQFKIKISNLNTEKQTWIEKIKNFQQQHPLKIKYREHKTKQNELLLQIDKINKSRKLDLFLIHILRKEKILKVFLKTVATSEIINFAIKNLIRKIRKETDNFTKKFPIEFVTENMKTFLSDVITPLLNPLKLFIGFSESVTKRLAKNITVLMLATDYSLLIPILRKEFIRPYKEQLHFLILKTLTKLRHHGYDVNVSKVFGSEQIYRNAAIRALNEHLKSANFFLLGTGGMENYPFFEILAKHSKNKFDVNLLKFQITNTSSHSMHRAFLHLLLHLSTINPPVHDKYVFDTLNNHFENMIPFPKDTVQLFWFWNNFKDKFDSSFDNNKFLKKIRFAGDVDLFSLFMEDKRVLDKLSDEELKMLLEEKEMLKKEKLEKEKFLGKHKFS